MLALQYPPEFADSGYWSVVPVIEDDEGRRPDLPAGAGYCAWYGDTHCVVRVTTPTSWAVDSLPATVLAEAAANGSLPALQRPSGRIGGR